MNEGRPPIWDDAKTFESKVQEYFEDETIVHTWAGLALYLGFESRQSLYDYSKKPQFSYPIKKALIRIETIYEERLAGNKAVGAIFALKNFGWKDTKEVDHTISADRKGLADLFTINAESSDKESKS